jgi:opacity protein-like surface antigen
MNRSLVLGSLLLCGALAAASPVLAQGAGAVSFGVTGGAVFPLRDQADVYKTGWDGGAVLTFGFGPAPIGLRIDGTYHELRTSSDVDVFFGDTNTRIISGTVDLVAGPKHMLVEPYFVGGVGVYDLRFRGQEVDTGNVFSESTTRFGWNVGGGLSFPLGRGTRTRVFVEARYTSISLDADRFRDSIHRGGSRFTMIPGNGGFMV